jgi:hypothetical protein
MASFIADEYSEINRRHRELYENKGHPDCPVCRGAGYIKVPDCVPVRCNNCNSPLPRHSDEPLPYIEKGGQGGAGHSLQQQVAPRRTVPVPPANPHPPIYRDPPEQSNRPKRGR